MDQSFLDKVSEIVNAHIQNPSFGVSELARELGMSHSSLFRKVHSQTGKSIKQVIVEIRLNKAHELLEEGGRPISEVAFLSGFSSQAYFSTCYHKYFGYVPGKTERKVKEVDNRQRGGSRQAIGWIRLLAPDAALLALLATLFIFMASTVKSREKISIAVLPFENGSSDANGETISDILWDEVISTLNQIRVFDVRSATSAESYRNADKPLPAIAEELKADYIIDGRSVSEGEKVKLTLELIEVKTEHLKWVQDYTFNIGELPDMMVKLAEHTAYRLNVILNPSERSALMVRCSESTESIENYLIGDFLISGRSMNPEKALAYFRKAIELDSTWASPWLGLARALQIMIAYEPKAEYLNERLKAAEKSHKIKPGPWSYYALAQYYLDIGDLGRSKIYYRAGIRNYPEYLNLVTLIARASQKTGNWKEAEKRYLSATRLAPANPSIYQATGRMYEMLRDFPKATAYYNQSRSLDPGLPSNYFSLADLALKWKGNPALASEIIGKGISNNAFIEWDLMSARYMLALSDICLGNFENALEEISRWFLPFPATWPPPYYYHPKHLYKAMVYGYMGSEGMERACYDSARTFIEERIAELPELTKSPGVISGLGMAWAGLGDKERASQMIRRVRELLSNTPDEYRGQYALEDVAWIYMKTGEYSKALKILGNLLSKPGPLTATMLEIDPKWTKLRDQPGFKELIMKYAIGVVEKPQELPGISGLHPELPAIAGSVFTDGRDGNVYQYRQIGDQTWMVQNLAYLPAVSPPNQGSIDEKYHYVFDFWGTNQDSARNTGNYAAYGVLYNWVAALAACPEGWHLPSDLEWKSLENHLGMSKTDANGTRERKSGSVGVKLKTAEGWYKNGNGDNSAGFYALPAGGRFYGGVFYEKGICTDFWSSTAISDSLALFRHLRYEFDGVYRYMFDKRNGFSVRCVRDVRRRMFED